jgi:hypothetical protein
LGNSNENGAGTTAGTAGTHAIDYLRSVYRNPLQPDNVRMRAAAIAIEYELPRLAVTAMVTAGDFADQLEKAIERSRKVSPTMIEGTANVSDNVPTDNGSSGTRRSLSSNGKPTIIDRRYRSW